MTTSSQHEARSMHGHHAGTIERTLLIGLIAFLTVVDLFGTQAILPALARSYGVKPAAIGFAVNATTMGMAAACLGVAYFSHRIDRRRGILISLTVLAIPTALLAIAPDLATFTVLRIAQGLCMASAFTLTLAYLGEHCSATDAGGAFAAYITGNVASNLFGRLLAAGLADHLGLPATFLSLAGLNLLGAVIVYVWLTQAAMMTDQGGSGPSPFSVWAEHLRNPLLRPSFAIGFCILFAFIGTFTFVNFVLVREPIALSQMSLGLVYFVFAPSIVTTLLAGRAVQRFGTRPTFWGSLAIAGFGLPLLVVPNLPAVLIGLMLIGGGTFFAQATATGFVSYAATMDRGSASGLYLASYFSGGLVGSAVLGQVFDRFGWGACVTGVGISLLAASLLAVRLRPMAESPLPETGRDVPTPAPAAVH
ncbi:MFS transporter [Microvirga sp. HBU67558]|uniref:MFS transporter n=1 Tax=Microvirga TaxID=186650 RepID=UPI001B3701A1|nr:MFS transporter [Microvirga sp. HBU67558]